jgi:hypothetical protein
MRTERTTQKDATIRVTIDGRDLPLQEMKEAGFDFHAARCWSLLVAFKEYNASEIVIWRAWRNGPNGRETLAIYRR